MWCLPNAALSVQKPSVLRNLHLQSALDVQQHLVLLSLALQVSSQLHQLLFHAGHLEGRTESLEAGFIVCWDSGHPSRQKTDEKMIDNITTSLTLTL